MKYRLGDTVRIDEPDTFKPSSDIFEGIVEFDKWGPRFAPKPSRLVILDTPEKVEAFNKIPQGGDFE